MMVKAIARIGFFFWLQQLGNLVEVKLETNQEFLKKKICAKY